MPTQQSHCKNVELSLSFEQHLSLEAQHERMWLGTWSKIRQVSNFSNSVMVPPKIKSLRTLALFFHLYITFWGYYVIACTLPTMSDKGFNLFFQDLFSFIMRIIYLLATLVILVSITEASYSNNNDPKGETFWIWIFTLKIPFFWKLRQVIYHFYAIF